MTTKTTKIVEALSSNTGIAAASVLSAGLAGRSARKDPQKLTRSMRRGALMGLVMLGTSGLVQVSGQRSEKAEVREASANINLSAVAASNALGVVHLVAAKKVIGDRDHLSNERILAVVGLSLGMNAARSLVGRTLRRKAKERASVAAATATVGVEAAVNSV